jgi:flagella basal body P-ring formation protein FlgA
MSQSRTFFLILLMLLPLGFPLSAQTEGNRQALSPDRVVETLRQYVLERSAWRPDQVEVVLRSFTPPMLSDGTVDLVVLKPTRGVTPGLRRFLVAIQVNGREEARLWVDSEVQVFENVVVTSQPLAHYESVTPDKVRLERRNLGDLPLQPLTSLDTLAGRQVSRPIEVNQVVTASMMELPRVIRRGSVVTLVYESVGLHVETPGRATEPGRVGDRIRVENPSSGKVLEGQILDDRRVRVN